MLAGRAAAVPCAGWQDENIAGGNTKLLSAIAADNQRGMAGGDAEHLMSLRHRGGQSFSAKRCSIWRARSLAPGENAAS